MFFQKMSVPVQSTVTISSFLGLDRRARGELGSFREMENLTSDGYPTLTVRPRRGLAGRVESPGGIAAKDALIWVDGHTLYIGGVATELVLTEGSKQLIGMGNWLIVWPDKKYINTGNLSQHGSLENRVQTQGQVTLSLCGAKGAALGDYLVSEEPPADPAGGCLWLDTTGEIPVLRQYGESGWSIREDTYVKIAAGGIGVGFTAGDGVAIEGCREESINGSHVLEAAEDGSLVVPGMIASQVTQTETLTVRRSVPEMDFVIESGNRLWGCKYGVVDGKAVNEIYASKLGDFKNWNCYAGRSTDSYAATRGSDGPFTGAADYLGSPLFFKEDCVERVYPSAAGAHQIVTVRCPGVFRRWRACCTTTAAAAYMPLTAVCPSGYPKRWGRMSITALWPEAETESTISRCWTPKISRSCWYTMCGRGCGIGRTTCGQWASPLAAVCCTP